MKTYRFKTKEEFEKEERWDDDNFCPEKWNSEGRMNKYLGKKVPSEKNKECDAGEAICIDGWNFSSKDYVLLHDDRIEDESPQVKEESNDYKFQIGDEVLISDDSEYKHQAIDENGKKVKGVVSRHENYNLYKYYVNWENGKANHYRDGDLIPYTDLTLRFKIGDKVIISKDSEYSNQQEFYDDGKPIPLEITEVYDESIVDDEFHYECSNSHSYSDSDLEPYES
jgi:hypothetical protein